MTTNESVAPAGENRRPPGETRSLLLAAAGRELSDAAAVWSHAVQDRGTTITSGVGEPQTGADFGDEGGRGRKSVGGIGRKTCFRVWDSPESYN